MNRQDRSIQPQQEVSDTACSAECPCKKLIPRVVRQQIESALARMAAEEAELWNRCFGEAAPSNRKARKAMIVRVASMRAKLSVTDNAAAPSFEDFFPDENT